MPYNTSAVRQLIETVFSDEELTIFCYDHFRAVYEQFSSGMSRQAKIQRLIDFCHRHDAFDRLLTLIKDINPTQYGKFGTAIGSSPAVSSKSDSSQTPDYTKSLIVQHQRRLQLLREKQALLGINSPPELLIEIEDIEAEIKRLESEPVNKTDEQGDILIQTKAARQADLKSGTDPQASGTQLSDQQLSSLKEALDRRSLVLFIGADLPREITGVPSRADLARDLAQRYSLDESLSLAEAAQRVSRARNRWEFTDFLHNKLDTVGLSPQPFHKQVATFVKSHQLEILITTAQSNLLEIALQQAGVPYNRVVRSSQLDFINPDRPTLIKLYGDVLEPDTLVVTEQDHLELLRDRQKADLIDEVKRAFRRNTVLFVGYNLADIDFRFIVDQIAERRFARTAYAVWYGLPEVDKRMWEDRGVIILEANPLPDLI